MPPQGLGTAPGQGPEGNGGIGIGRRQGLAIGAEIEIHHRRCLFIHQGVERGGQVPKTDLLVFPQAGGNEIAAIGAQGDAFTRVGNAAVGKQGLARGSPEAHRMIQAGGDQKLAVGMEGHVADGGLMADQGVLELALGIPEFDRAVGTGGRQRLAIGAKGEASHRCGVARHRFQELSGAGIPEFDGLIGAGGGEDPPIGAEGDRPHHGLVSGQGPLQGAAGIPQLHGAIDTAGGQQPPLGMKGQANHRRLMTLQGLQ